MKKPILLFAGLALLTMKTQAQTTVTDYDGNVYNTVTIGTQVWMAENLKVTHYRNGDSIPNVTDNIQWSNLTTGAYCNYDNSVDTAITYGSLYNFYAVFDNRNICPTDWHVPSDAEWTTLTTYLGGISIAGGKLKETGTTHWQSPNTGADNSSGFTALPGGFRGNTGAFGSVEFYGYWWSVTENDTASAWDRVISYGSPNVFPDYDDKIDGFSIRCVRDSLAIQINENSIDKDIQIYPNPTIDRVFINITERHNLKMQVYNIIGDCVFQSDLNSGTNEIDISSLSKGIYIIKLTGTDWTVQRKLTKD